MPEGKAAKYGRVSAEMIGGIIAVLPLADSEKEIYRSDFIAKLKTYSLVQRKVGEPRNEGSKDHLEDIVSVDLLNPNDFAAWIMQGWNFCYQKETVRRIIRSLNEHLMN